MLKMILTGVVVTMLGLLSLAAMRPDTFRVSRSAIIKASPGQLFPAVNNLHRFNEWNPWAKLDSNATSSFEGASEGVGAKMSWNGNKKVGQGSMTIIETRPDEFIKMKMEYLKPFEAVHTSEFSFKADGENTLVTWSTYGPQNFMCKVFGLFFSMDTLIGGQFEKGLNDLKTRTESRK